MPKYLVRVAVQYSGEDSYEIEANNPKEAVAIAKRGDAEATDQELQCDSCEWETADVKKIES